MSVVSLSLSTHAASFKENQANVVVTVVINNESIANAEWPKYDEAKLVSDTYTLVVQVNGKLRGTAVVSVDATEDEIKTIAFQDENVKRHTEGKEIVKVIVIKGKIVNIVVKG